MLIASNISRNFGGRSALRNVSFEINAGEIVGFTGKNGAGKTTLMRILSSFLSPSSGTVSIDGDNVNTHSIITRQKIGYLPEKPPLYPHMSVQHYLKFAAEIKGVPNKRVRVQLAKVLEECNLDHVKEKTISSLSKGYKQRVGIAQTIIHEPKLLILDEPTNGLDPMQIRQILALIKNQGVQRTVLLSTHTLNEIEQVAQRVLMIKAGQLVVDEPLHALLNSEAPALTLDQIFLRHHPEQTASYLHAASNHE